MRPLVASMILLCVFSVEAFAQKPSGRVSISVNHLDISPDERVTSLQIKLSAATVQDISNLPIGWNLHIDNSASWLTTIDGDHEVGAAALFAKDFSRLCFTVKKDESMSKFAVSGVVSVTKDWDKFREVQLKPSDFMLKPVP
jgi:hypothetical protein